MGRGKNRGINLHSMSLTWGILILLCVILLVISPMLSAKPGYFAAQGAQISPLVADGQFVWGPNVGNFDIAKFLQSQNSPLLDYSEDIQAWAAYTSVNPKIVLALLEVRNRWISDFPEDISEERVLQEIEYLSMNLATAFYNHMYAWGSRSEVEEEKSLTLPKVEFEDAGPIEMDPDTTSGSFAIASILADVEEMGRWETLVAPKSQGGFSDVFQQLFPNTNLLDESNNLEPSGLPPDDFLQLPFPLGADWTFNGTHSWHGGDIGPDRSSMDFSTNWPRGSTLPDHYTVASHEGIGYVYAPSRTSLPCWMEIYYEINPGEVWSTSYYHLTNLGDPGDRGLISRNQSVGKLGTEVCNGGFASSAHVHFTLRYNGAFYDLDDLKLSGWIVHSGPDPYYSGYLERDGEFRYPYDRLVNDYHEYYGKNLEYALHFSGADQSGGNQIRIQIDDPDQNTPGPPADVGMHDFVIEWWMNAIPGNNSAPSVPCGPNSNWKVGNILFDRSNSIGGSEWGVSLIDGLIAFGVRGVGGDEITLCSESRVDDGEWHHVGIQRNRWEGSYPDGQLWIFIDGQLEAIATGPEGDISYPDNASPGDACGRSTTGECVNLDPYLILGHGKDQSSLPFHGTIDDIRFSWWLRYQEDFNPVVGFQEQDSLTVGLIRFNEGAGEWIFDTGGFDGGTTNGQIIDSADIISPIWVLSEIFVKNPIHVPLYLVD